MRSFLETNAVVVTRVHCIHQKQVTPIVKTSTLWITKKKKKKKKKKKNKHKYIIVETLSFVWLMIYPWTFSQFLNNSLHPS